ncbi:PREDICTED: uncharacterized protein LOC109192880 [Ipomoea nil]|uniref:uncharacterized protein LOC109192880 n=1 Tax=Ipomoea nil TaxID=35883 RepID=UPI0009011064|nr:PREDICTED: uncharacterized protein LOC109192880 [Ipomoea nil]
MASFSGLGIGLSFVFGCILMGLVGELYYLLWVKRRIRGRENEDNGETKSKSASEFGFLFCWKKPGSGIGRTGIEELTNSVRNPETNCQNNDLEVGTGKDSLLKGYGEEGVESELMRLHNLCGPPRFLFTIKEETKEDLESEGGRSRKGSRTRSLSDLIMAADTPMSSPPSKPLPIDSFSLHGFNPLFESSTDAELNRLKSSPPPKFKFLRDAEEKLIRRLVEEAERSALRGSLQDFPAKPPSNPPVATEEKAGSFMSFLVRSKERELQQPLPLYHSTPSQVLPLASSPSAFRPIESISAMQ